MLSCEDTLLARIEIEALNVEFAYRIDHGRSATVADLFTDDGWYGRETGERSAGRDAIRTAYAGRAATSQRTARHVFSNLRLDFRSTTEANGVVILLLFAGDGPPPLSSEPMLVQDYIDTYRKVGGRWLFASRETRQIFVSPNYKRVLQLGKT